MSIILLFHKSKSNIQTFNYLMRQIEILPSILPYHPDPLDSASKCPDPLSTYYPRLQHTPFYKLRQIFQGQCTSSQISSSSSHQDFPLPLHSTFHRMTGTDCLHKQSSTFKVYVLPPPGLVYRHYTRTRVSIALELTYCHITYQEPTLPYNYLHYFSV